MRWYDQCECRPFCSYSHTGFDWHGDKHGARRSYGTTAVWRRHGYITLSKTLAVNMYSRTTVRCTGSAGVLHLSLAPKRKKKSIKWSQDTVDNENMGKKKSKSAHISLIDFRLWCGHVPSYSKFPFVKVAYFAECCIFHAERQFGDWSDGNDSDCECQDDWQWFHMVRRNITRLHVEKSPWSDYKVFAICKSQLCRS